MTENEQILGVFKNKSECAHCNKIIQNIHEHTVHDKDKGLWYHAECYKKHKATVHKEKKTGETE